jgi:hypothetical protein
MCVVDDMLWISWNHGRLRWGETAKAPRRWMNMIHQHDEPLLHTDACFIIMNNGPRESSMIVDLCHIHSMFAHELVFRNEDANWHMLVLFFFQRKISTSTVVLLGLCPLSHTYTQAWARVHTHVYVCMHTHLHVYTCRKHCGSVTFSTHNAYVRTFIHVQHTYIHTYIHTHIHKHMLK